jgi:hypothetical protein
VIKRSAKILIELVAIGVAGLTVLLVFAAFRLSMGPVSLDLLTPHIEAGLNTESGDFKVALGGTVLAWSEAERDLDLVVKNVRVTNRAGAEQAFVPELAMGLSVRALIFGRFRPTRFELLGPRMALVRGEDGRLGFSDTVDDTPVAAPVPSAAPATPQEKAKAKGVAEGELNVGGAVFAKIMDSLIHRPASDHPLYYLKSVSVTKAGLEFRDLRTGVAMHSPESDFILIRGPEGVDLSARLNLELGGKTARIEMGGGYNADDGRIKLKARFNDLVLARLAGLGEEFAHLSAAQFPAAGAIGLNMTPDGIIRGITLEANGGPGKIAVKGFYAKPVAVRSVRLKASLAQGLKRIKLDHLRADFGGPKVGVTGEAQRNGDLTTAVFDVTADNVTVKDLKRLWPKSVAEGGRAWIMENLLDGRIVGASTRLGLTIQHRPGAEDVVDLATLEGSFGFNGVKVHYLKPMPPIVGLSGTAKVGKSAITFSAGAGQVAGVRLDDGKIRLKGLAKESQKLEIETVARGPLGAALALLDHPRLDLIKGFGIAPSTVTGETATRLTLKMPLVKNLTFDMVDLAAAANLRGVKLPKAALDSDVTDGDLRLQVDKRGMDVNGTIRLGGVPARLVWTENFYSTARFQGRYEVTGVIDSAGQKRLGLDAAPYVSGPMGFDVIVTRFKQGRTAVAANLDVTETALASEEIEWTKKPGVPGFARFSLDMKDNKVRQIRNLDLKAGDLEATGWVRLAEDGRTVESFNFPKLIFGDSDIRVTGAARPEGGLRLSVRGPKIDLRRFLDARRREGPKKPLAIDAEIDQVRVGPGPPIHRVKGTLSRRTGDWDNMSIRGTVGKAGKSVLITITPGKTWRNLSITSDDAAATLKSFDISEDMVGGRLTIKGRYDDTKPRSPLSGVLRISKFQMVRWPLVAKLLSTLSLPGILDALSGNGIAFDEAIVPFTKKDDDLRIEDARAFGAALGFTAKGWVDLEKDQLDVTGTVVPAYTINKILGWIPLLGKILVGERGSGVFAATYRMHGPLSKPITSTNPLATFAPGVLRELLGIFDTPSEKPPAEKAKDKKGKTGKAGKKAKPAPAKSKARPKAAVKPATKPAKPASAPAPKATPALEPLAAPADAPARGTAPTPVN